MIMTLTSLLIEAPLTMRCSITCICEVLMDLPSAVLPVRVLVCREGMVKWCGGEGRAGCLWMLLIMV